MVMVHSYVLPADSGIFSGRLSGPPAELDAERSLLPSASLRLLQSETAAHHSFSAWQAHGFEETQATFLQTDLLKLLVKKCSKGTGFSKTWLLRDLEVRDKGDFC